MFPEKMSHLVVPSNFVIQKPRKKAGSCTSLYEESPSSYGKALSEGKKCKPVEAKSSSSESVSYWLKPGVSLPRVHLEDRPDAGEPYSIRRGPCEQKLEEVPESVFGSKSSSVDSSGRESPSRKSSAAWSDFEKFNTCFRDLQNVSGLSKCNFEFEVSVENQNNIFDIAGEELEESHALRQWKVWLKRRKRLQEYLEKKLKRPASSLILNRSETFRQVIESKAAEVYCNFLKPLKKDGRKTEKILCQTVCFGESVPSKKRPEIEFIGLPEIIKKEKNLIKDSGKPREIDKGQFEETVYYQKRVPCHVKKKKGAKVTRLQCVDIEHLAVVGRKYPPEEEVEVNERGEPESAVSVVTTETSKKSSDATEEQTIFFLVVDDREITYEAGSDIHLSFSDESLTWRLHFGSNPVGTLVEKTLRVENRGTVATTCKWIRPNSEVEKLFDSFRPALAEPWFFFNKNSEIFAPGKIYDLKFYCRARREGARTETWYLKTDPPISQNGADKLKIILSSFATSDSVDPQINAVEKYLNKKIGISISRKIVNDIFLIATNQRYMLRELEYRSLLLEDMLFEFHNPKHYYHNSEVGDLKQIFLRTFLFSQKEWDYSLSTLLKLVRASGANKSEKDTLMKQISEKCRKLFRPNYVTRSTKRKYTMAYQILCSTFNSLDDDFDYFKEVFSFWRYDNLSVCQYNDAESSSEELNWEGEATPNNIIEMSLHNTIFFELMLDLTVYHKLCCAAERIAAMLESLKFTEPCRRSFYSRVLK